MSRYDGHRGRRPEPAVPAGLTELLSRLEGPPDFWDRPRGDWGAPPTGDGEVWREERAHANSCYRLGSKALRRGELSAAADWLGRAGEQEHPGALFRLGVVMHRQCGDDGGEDVLFLVVEAARLGHGDARVLLEERAAGPGYEAAAAGPVTVQDPEFVDEIRAAIGIPGTPVATVPGRCPVPGPRRAGEDRPHHGTGPAAGTGEARADDATASEEEPDPGQEWCTTPEAGHTAGLPNAPGQSRLWSPAPMRPASLTDMARQVPEEPRPVERWESALRVLDVLGTIADADRPISAEQISRATSLPHQVLERLLLWLCEQGLASSLIDGGYTAGPVLRMMSGREAEAPQQVLQQALTGLRDAVGAAVYVSSYTDGEVKISQYADGPTTPKVHEWVDFRASAHASAVGKSLLAQLDFEGRMDHLSRRRAVRLTSRTITDHHALFRALDGPGPQAAQFDLLEYSTSSVCVAVPLGIAGQAGCVALSLPVTQRHRLVEAARILSSRSAGLLLSLLLAAGPAVREPATQSADGLVFPHPALFEPPTLEHPAPRIRHLVSSGR
ncbi:IclR family transcriptional regulator C-terminal domain-containing protein [Streptomyces sp. NPDC000410]|uniref:IclR family transcriptional regulator domain-containing protein n=1 Tax=Streptomyces sp. NPDC000410 TaxID=3154254 RepID=UPI00331F9633